jgi:hypothetical protein
MTKTCEIRLRNVAYRLWTFRHAAAIDAIWRNSLRVNIWRVNTRDDAAWPGNTFERGQDLFGIQDERREDLEYLLRTTGAKSAVTGGEKVWEFWLLSWWCFAIDYICDGTLFHGRIWKDFFGKRKWTSLQFTALIDILTWSTIISAYERMYIGKAYAAISDNSANAVTWVEEQR